MALAADVASGRDGGYGRGGLKSVACRFSVLPPGSLSSPPPIWRHPWSLIAKLVRSEVSALSSAGLKPRDLRSFFQTSMWRRAGRPVGCFPVVSSPYRMSLGMRPSSILHTCPSQRRRLWARMANMLSMPAWLLTSYDYLILTLHWTSLVYFSGLKYVLGRQILHFNKMRHKLRPSPSLAVPRVLLRGGCACL